jgi:lipopolysaccharide export LptBFGC system permease protein LptF
VFRPARRVSWGTRIFAALIFFLAVGAVATFVVFVLPTQIAALTGSEARELRTARQATADVSASTDILWADMAGKGSLSLPGDRITQDLALAQSTEKAADDALGHVQAA